MPATASTSLRRLDAETERTRHRIAALTRDFAAIAESVAQSPPDDEHDPEGATLGWERQQIAALLEQARTELEELRAAADRVHAGTYGACESCGRPIAAARLEIRPATRLCVACAAAHPQRRPQRHPGG